MTHFTGVPEAVYGVLSQDHCKSEIEEVAEQARRLGYAIFDSGFTGEDLKDISDAFNRTREEYVLAHGEDLLKSVNEFHTIRAPLIHGEPAFLRLAMNGNLIAVLNMLISGKFILNQQNGIINPPGEPYNQGAWHRDLPYQHYVSSSPLAMNALFCIDDFTPDNGSTYVLPATHREVNFPSTSYICKNALQVEAKAGQYILLDCMLYHSGGFNKTCRERRAVNHLYTIPYFRQQINLPKNISAEGLSEAERDILGFTYLEPASVEQYLALRATKSVPSR
jgi:ectoine hydroxylase-related dioxygenase (phytanoyl-CoA dioxygenase family)